MPRPAPPGRLFSSDRDLRLSAGAKTSGEAQAATVVDRHFRVDDAVDGEAAACA